MYCGLFSNSLIISALYSVSYLLAKAMIKEQPIIISVNEGRSYLKLNFSPRYRIANSVLMMIPAAFSVDNRTKSAKGRIKPCTTEVEQTKKTPNRYLKVRYGDLFFLLAYIMASFSALIIAIFISSHPTC